MSEPYNPRKMTCKEVQLEMIPMQLDGWVDDLDERLAFGAHILACPKCDKEYQETIQLVDIFKWYGKVGKELLRQKRAAENQTTAEEPEEAVKRRIPECTDYETPQPRRRLLRWLMPIPVCCLLIGVLCWWIWPKNDVTIAKVESDAEQVAKSPEPRPDNDLAKESSVGGLESSPNGGDGPLTAAVKKDLKDTDS